ncbi:MAG: N-acetylmuramoyl-L-alanine amidase [Candidatus Kapaibacterium sp.]
MVIRRILIAVSIAGLVAGCAPSKKITTVTRPAPPLIPSPSSPYVPPTAPEAPVHILVAYPVPNQWRPNVDSNFIFGAVGNGNASLTINGYPVPVWKNGAFLAFLPMPFDGVYHLVAQRGDDIDSATVAYRAKTISTEHGTGENGKEKEHGAFVPNFAHISKGSDTLQTGNDVAPGARTPDGNREWFFPHRAKLRLVGQEGKYFKVELDKNTFAWVADTNFGYAGERWQTPQISQSGKVKPSLDFVDLVLPADYNPFQITPNGTELRIHVYGASHPSRLNTQTSDPLIQSVGYDSTGEDVDYTVKLTKPVWGYKAFYMDNGSLDVRIRRSPHIDANNPLKGIRIMLDPGHPPGGAIGPTGLTEREANLAVALRIRDQLTAKGAIVLMTHTSLEGLVSDFDQVEELDARSALAVQDNADLMVSTHENAFPDGTDPFLNYGTSTFYFHPFSAPLAAELDRAISEVTGIPNLGSFQKSLAICRPTWMPCALTESLDMMFPDQEAKLRDPKFLDTLAAAHVRGIENFLREQSQ